MKLGIIADIHEDIENLKKAMQIFEKENCQELVCLGDIIGYSDPNYSFKDSRDANACIEIIKTNFEIVITGNHDLYAIKKLPSFNAGFIYPENWYEIKYSQREILSNGKTWLYEKNELPINISNDEISFIDSLPEYKIKEYNDYKILFSHFNYPNLSGSLTSHPTRAKHLKEHFQFMKNKDCLLSFSGHAHFQGLCTTSKRCFRVHKFGKRKLKDKRQWISLPCSVKNGKKSAVTIFNTNSMEIETIIL